MGQEFGQQHGQARGQGKVIGLAGDIYTYCEGPYENISPHNYPSFSARGSLSVEAESVIEMDDVTSVSAYYKSSSEATGYFSMSLGSKNFTEWDTWSEASIGAGEAGETILYVGYSESASGPELLYFTINLEITAIP